MTANGSQPHGIGRRTTTPDGWAGREAEADHYRVWGWFCHCHDSRHWREGAQRSNATFVRINPDARPEDPSIISVALPALHALQAINDALPESFWDRAGYRPALSRTHGESHETWRFAARQKIRSGLWGILQVPDSTGSLVRVRERNVEHLYEGQLEGLPTSDDCIRAMARLVDKAGIPFQVAWNRWYSNLP